MIENHLRFSIPLVCRRLFPGLATAVLVVLAASGQVAGASAEGEVVQVLRDYESVPPRAVESASIAPYYWPAETKARAAEYSTVELIKEEGTGNRCLRFRISPDLPWTRDGRPIESLALPPVGGSLPDILDPRSDSLRMKVRVLSGRIVLSAGGPTVYFGNSDVHTRRVELLPSADWQTVELSLIAGLTRNQRRAGFSRGATVLHYTRWIQEPLALYIDAGSHGEFLLDQLELVSHGQGQAYPTFAANEVRPLAVSADFDAPDDMPQVFTAFIQGDTDLPATGPALLRPRWTPATCALATDGDRRVLEVTNHFTEEVSVAGILSTAPPEANAIRLRVWADTERAAYETISLDFLAFAAPAGDFPWARLESPASWQAKPAIGFRYYMCRNNMAGLSLAYFHVRRVIPAGQWTELTLPFADFVCAYGQGTCAPWFAEQRPLAAEQLSAIGWLGSFRQQAKLRVLIDDIAFVQVPGDSQALRSYYQPQPQSPPGAEDFPMDVKTTSGSALK